MARPQKDGMDYFPHDVDASSDEKLEILQSLYGNDGYAFYFKLLERIYRTRTFELDISDAETIQVLARKVAVTVEKFMQMLETALKWGAFDREAYEQRRVLTSNGIKKRAAVVLEKRKRMRQKYREERARELEAEIRAETSPETGEETPQRKEKKRKVKKSKVSGSKDTTIHERKISNSSASSSCNKADAQEEADADGILPQYGECVKLLEEEFGRPLSPLEAEQVKELSLLFPFELIREAVKRAVAAGALRFNYIRAILERWRRANLQTVQEVLEEEARKKGRPHKVAAGANGRDSPPDPEGEKRRREELERRRRQEKIHAAATYIRLTLGDNPPREKTEALARDYGEDIVQDILRMVYGGEPP